MFQVLGIFGVVFGFSEVCVVWCFWLAVFFGSLEVASPFFWGGYVTGRQGSSPCMRAYLCARQSVQRSGMFTT